MQTSSIHKALRLAAGSMIAACSIFGTAGLASADDKGGDGDKDPITQPPPGGPNLPTDPSEGLPVPIPGGGG
jgi:hypothetical protein